MNKQTKSPPGETLDPEDWEAMRALGHRMVDDTMDYIETLRDRPVWQHAPPEVKAHFQGPPPPGPEPSDKVYQEYVRSILPYQVGNSHPTVLGLGCGMRDRDGDVCRDAGSLNGCGQRVVFLHQQQLRGDAGRRLVQDAARFPATASGLLTSGCSASNLIGLAVARNTMAGFDVRAGEWYTSPEQMTIYCSDEAHSSVQKAVELLGFGNDSLRRVPVNDSLQIDIAALKTDDRNRP